MHFVGYSPFFFFFWIGIASFLHLIEARSRLSCSRTLLHLDDNFMRSFLVLLKDSSL